MLVATLTDDDATGRHKAIVLLDGETPETQPCRFCGHDTGYLTGPVGPHADGMRCERCDRHLRWLPKFKADESLIEN